MATTTKPEEKDTGVVRQTYTYTPFTPSETVNGLGTKQSTAESAYDTHINTGFTYGNQTAYEDVLKRLNNGEKFSYDLNGDALYQQYKDKYIQQGKMAMADTMGQAAALTGGYGNSYAASVGNQAYQASLQNLNDVSLQLYQLALDKHNVERQDLYNQFNALSTDRNTEYGMWSNEGTMLNNNRTYYGTEYDNAYNRELTEHTTSEGFKYQDVADANAAAEWDANYNLAVDQFNLQKAQVGASKGSNGTYTVPSTPFTMSTEDYTYWTDKFAGVTTKADAEALRETMAIAVGDSELAYELYYQWANKYQGSSVTPTTVYRGVNGQVHMKN